MPLSVGDKLGHYEVISLLGQGGMGEVYSAKDTKLDREVAIKVLPQVLARDEYIVVFLTQSMSLGTFQKRGAAGTRSMTGDL